MPFKWRLTTKYSIPMTGGGTSDSIAMCADGKRLVYMNVQGGNIKQGWISDPGLLFKNGSVTDVFNVFTGKVHPNCCVFNGPNFTGMWAIVGWGVNTGVAPATPAETMVLRSPSGNGGDWVQVAPPWQTMNVGGNWIEMESSSKMIGQPHITASGRWVVSAFRLLQFNNQVTYKWAAVYTSDNQGETWVESFSRGFYIVGGPYGYFNSRNITPNPVDGRLWWACEGNSGGPINCYTYSFAADGTGPILELDENGGRWNYLAADETYLYRSSGETLQRSANPASDVWETIYSAFPLSGGNLILQKMIDPIHERYAQMSNGRVVNPKIILPGVRVFQRDDVAPRVIGGSQNTPTNEDWSARVLGPGVYDGRRR